jgi:dihydrofolate reductase
MTCFVTPQSASAPTLWVSECSRPASAVGQRRAPFHTPVYVLTHEKREAWVRPGGTTFYFVNDGPESALEQARESAGGRDIRIAGGADVIQQYLNLGVIEELEIAVAPVLFGGGSRLFENLREPVPRFRIDKVVDSPAATHLRYVRE